MPARLIYVMAKAPRVGEVKTRLCPPLEPSQAAELYLGFLRDSLELAGRVPNAEVRAFCPSPSMAAELAGLLPVGCRVASQSAPGLGAGLEECFRVGLGDGFRAVAVMASDNPTLPSALVEQAFERLEQDDVVLGPADDGGYYLVAARAVYSSLFREMVWSTTSVLDETLERCRVAGLRSSLLEPWYDVDSAEDLGRLSRELDSLPAERARHTRAALRAAGVGSQELPGGGARLCLLRATGATSTSRDQPP